MGVKTYNNVNSPSKYVFNRKAGRNIVEHRPVFSPDGESVLLIVENIVRVYNIRTGDCVRLLEVEGDVKELVAIEFPQNEDYNLCGCSSDGCITTWTWENGAVLREISLELPQNSRVLSFNLVDSNECFVVSISPQNPGLTLGTYSIKTGLLQYEYMETRPIYYGILRVSIGCYKGDRYAAIITGTKYLYIQNLNQPHLRTYIVNYNYLRIIAVAAHPSENAVAITDTLGRTTLIRGNLYNNREVGREVLHWHFLPPMAVTFSVQGNYLLTGGMEKVVIKWTLGHLANKASEKIFLPRLPGFVKHIACSTSHVAVALSNNSIVISNAQLNVVSTILECGGLSQSARALGPSLVFHRPLSALLMGGRVGHLQLFSTTTDKVLYNIDITNMNSIPSERLNLLPLETEISCAAVSASGTWLVTSEYRNDGHTYPEEKLKFWIANIKSSSPFKLHTCVNLSHGGCNVVSLALNNKGEFCVSAGTDQKFRIWKREKTNLRRNKYSWACLTACYYSSGIAYFMSNPVLNNFKNDSMLVLGKTEELPYLREIDERDDIISKLFNVHSQNGPVDNNKNSLDVNDEYHMGDVAISQDGSLIAAWFGCKLTLWDTHLCNLRTTLSHPALRPKGMHVQFGNHDAAHYLACTSRMCLAVWSLLSLTVKWLVQLNPTNLVADPFTNKMAVVTGHNDVFVFTPHSATPLLNQKRLLDQKTGVFKHCAFGASVDNDIRLYLMRNDCELYCLEPEKSPEGPLEMISHRNAPTSTFSALLAEQQLSEVRQRPSADANYINSEALGNRAIEQFLSAAPHMVPPVSMLCTSFLQQISGHDETEQHPEEDDNNVMTEDQQSSDDEDDVEHHSVTQTPKVTAFWTPNYEKVKEKRLKIILSEPPLDLHMTGDVFGV